ncbi:mannose-1-phosphate guanylyltransferase/mannose-6-phosphate isomerase [Gorillibacterium sp. sgz500922]|uniref:mannose-1-phosphate guanylyltransferase/mannose-6-phosphate isomerase n=1 Tax=Gorillibacterium sp. sgz500922 TaxID=3446694 RepID=UPI003F6696FB
MINVVLCGGNGSRLWPVSRSQYPKQFAKIISDVSFFQQTVLRNRSLCSGSVIVSNENQYFLALDQLAELKHVSHRFILEPLGRNTAPAIALACFSVDPEELVLVTPSDHSIQHQENYEKAVSRAVLLAEEGNLVTFGIKPTYPEIGYGYIEATGTIVQSFREKPDYGTAKRYIEEGKYYWNSGMFVFRASVFLDELQKYAPSIFQASKEAYEQAEGDLFKRINPDAMYRIPSGSVDYEVMEKSQIVKMVSAEDMGWSDVGSFESLYKELAKDDNMNNTNRSHIGLNSSKNLILGNSRTIATIDVEDLIVVDTPDALLVSKMGSSQKVKEIVDQLNRKQSSLSHNQMTRYRPWGNYTTLAEQSGYRIRLIIVKPGEKIANQRHYHRSEHWIVLNGTALLIKEGKSSIIPPNESAMISIGEEHELRNPGKINLVIVEIQTGDYLLEDDIHLV